jgi:hypothetical protein
MGLKRAALQSTIHNGWQHTQMIRVDAGPIEAYVVNIHARRNIAHKIHEGGAMRGDPSVLSGRHAVTIAPLA